MKITVEPNQPIRAALGFVQESWGFVSLTSHRIAQASDELVRALDEENRCGVAPYKMTLPVNGTPWVTSWPDDESFRPEDLLSEESLAKLEL